MTNISQELLKKCKSTSEQETAEFFARIGLICIDLNFIIFADDNETHITDIDGIFLDKDNEIIIIYDDSTLSNGHNPKITAFFSKCQDPQFEQQIYDKHPELPHHPIYIIYIDKSRNSDANIKSIEHEIGKFCKIVFKDDFDYFNELAINIGKWTKNDLYNFINIFPPNKRIQIDAIKIYIGNNPAYVYADKPTDILKYSYVSRRRDKDNGYQRMIDFNRVKKIADLITQKKLGGFPNSLLLNSTVDIEEYPKVVKSHCPSHVKITLPDHYSSCRVVDGQHRLISFALLNDTQRSHYMLSVILLSNLDLQEEKKMFLDINTNAKQVDPNLEYDLIASLDSCEDNQKNQLVKYAVDIISELEKKEPMKNRIYRGLVSDKKKDTITLKSFVDSLITSQIVDYKSGVFESIAKNYDLTIKILSKIFIEVNKSDTKDYLLSNRGVDLICKFWGRLYSDNKMQENNFDAIFTKTKDAFFSVISDNLDSIKSNVGGKGFTQTLALVTTKVTEKIKEGEKVELPSECPIDHSNLDQYMNSLNEDQSNPGRHKCAPCSYQNGYEDGKNNKPKRDFKEMCDTLPINQRGAGRHKSVQEAYDLGYTNGVEERDIQK